MSATASPKSVPSHPPGEASYETKSSLTDDAYLQRRETVAAEKAADAAARSNWISIIGAVLTIIGLIWVKGTLDATRRGAEATKDAADETRRIGEAQVRAYMVVENPVIVASPIGFLIGAAFANSGQSPARSTKVFFDIYPIARNGDRPRKPNEILYVSCDDVRVGSSTPHRRAPIQIDIDAFRNGNLQITIDIRIEYKDVFDKEHFETLHYWLTQGDYRGAGPGHVFALTQVPFHVQDSLAFYEDPPTRG